jgi:hypothetical protein
MTNSSSSRLRTDIHYEKPCHADGKLRLVADAVPAVILNASMAQHFADRPEFDPILIALGRRYGLYFCNLRGRSRSEVLADTPLDLRLRIRFCQALGALGFRFV